MVGVTLAGALRKGRCRPARRHFLKETADAISSIEIAEADHDGLLIGGEKLRELLLCGGQIGLGHFAGGADGLHKNHELIAGGAGSASAVRRSATACVTVRPERRIVRAWPMGWRWLVGQGQAGGDRHCGWGGRQNLGRRNLGAWRNRGGALGGGIALAKTAAAAKCSPKSCPDHPSSPPTPPTASTAIATAGFGGASEGIIATRTAAGTTAPARGSAWSATRAAEVVHVVGVLGSIDELLGGGDLFAAGD